MIIIGAGIIGKLVIDIIKENDLLVEGFIDDFLTEENYLGFPILGSIDDLIQSEEKFKKFEFVLAIGDNDNRLMIYNRLKPFGFVFKNIISNKAIISESCEIDSGNIVFPLSYIGSNTKIGSFNIVFSGVVINHDNIIGDFCFIPPNVSLGGFSKLADFTKLKMNEVVNSHSIVNKKSEVDLKLMDRSKYESQWSNDYSDITQRNLIYYNSLYSKFDNDLKSLGWSKDRQFARFKSLVEGIDLDNKRILDIGCGFGDLFSFLYSNYSIHFDYVGIDLMEEFISKARLKHKKSTHLSPEFYVADFLSHHFEERFDFIFASGIFNINHGESTMPYHDAILEKAYSLCNVGLSFNYLSSNVDFRDESVYYSDPFRILSTHFKYSRNLIFKNNFCPYEYTITLFKDESVSKNLVFERFNSKI